MKGEFEGKVALVTGGSSGIGRATALAFARAGAKVVVVSRRATEGEKTIHQIQAEGGEGIFIGTDISKAKDVESMVNKIIEVYGGLDCAFNNAGVGLMGMLTDSSEADWDYMFDTNLKGTWLCLKHEIPQMLARGGGVIVNTASIAALVGQAGFTIYSASKAGIIGLSKAAAIEYAQSNIRINVVSPAAVQTEMLDVLPTEVMEQLKEKHPVGRIGKPEEIAETVLWLCSERASFITGHNLVIDGGLTVQ